MQRRTAVAAASAISISLVSAVVALGANVGALGFAGSPPAKTPPAAVATQSTTGSNPAPASSTNASREREDGESRDRERETPEGSGVTTASEQGTPQTGTRDD